MKSRKDVITSITNDQFMNLCFDFLHDRRFDHREWSIFYAGQLEMLAARIRHGYAEDAKAREAAGPPPG